MSCHSSEITAIMGRLPEGVEYTFIKMIVSRAPSPLTTLLWVEERINEPLWAMFQNSTYGAIDRELQKREQALSAESLSEERHGLQAVRQEFVTEFFETISLRAGTKGLWVEIHDVDFSRFPPELRPSGLQRLTRFIEVWRDTARRPRLVEQHVIESGPSPWGDETISWLDPLAIVEICCRIFRTHFPDLMRFRPGGGWRSRHQSPAGWPLIAQYLIPALYDYLRPFYPVRSYRHSRTTASSGKYPVQLRRDIVDIVKGELPHLASELTIQRVTAAIQRYLKLAPKERPIGVDLFRTPQAVA